MLALLIFSNYSSAQLGELPDNPNFTRSIDGVDIELSIRFWVNPELVENSIPQNVNYSRVQSFGIPDSIISHEFKDWIDASLIVTSAKSIQFRDSTSKLVCETEAEAFWWLQILSLIHI